MYDGLLVMRTNSTKPTLAATALLVGAAVAIGLLARSTSLNRYPAADESISDPANAPVHDALRTPSTGNVLPKEVTPDEARPPRKDDDPDERETSEPMTRCLAGVVREYESERPVGNAAIHIVRTITLEPARDRSFAPDPLNPDARTNTQGRYELVLPADAAVGLLVIAEGFPERRSGIARGDTEIRPVYLSGTPPPPLLRGVVRMTNGASAEGADVRLVTRGVVGRTTFSRQVSDSYVEADGTFSVATKPDVGVWLIVKTPESGSPNVVRTERLLRANTKSVEINVRPGASIHGRVVSADGRALSRARVRAEKSGELAPTAASAKTDGEGRFELWGLQPGATYIVIANNATDDDAGYRSHVLEGVTAQGGEDSPAVELRLATEYRIHGSLQFAKDEPPPRHVHIAAHRVGEPPVDALAMWEKWAIVPVDVGSGAFSTRPLPGGRYELILTEFDGVISNWQPAPRVFASPGDHDVNIHPVWGAAIRGTVWLGSSGFRGNAAVLAIPSEGPTLRTTTGPHGSFAFLRVDPSLTYRIEAWGGSELLDSAAPVRPNSDRFRADDAPIRLMTEEIRRYLKHQESLKKDAK